MKKQTFTLVELLVVIGIIVILAALLLPALNGAMAKAEETNCLNNMGQIGKAFSMYSADYGSYVMPTSGDLKAATWVGLAYSYLKSGEVFECNADSNARSFALNDDDPSIDGEKPSFNRSYVANSGIHKVYNTKPIKVYAVEAPATTISLAPQNSSSYALRVTKSSGNFSSTEHNRHKNAANYLFADQHAAKLQSDTVRDNVNDDTLTNSKRYWAAY